MTDVICLGEILIDFVSTVEGVQVGDSPAFEKKPGSRGIYFSARTAENRWFSSSTLEDREGNRLEWSLTIVREDSIFHLRPPPPQVNEFTVTEVPRPGR